MKGDLIRRLDRVHGCELCGDSAHRNCRVESRKALHKQCQTEREGGEILLVLCVQFDGSVWKQEVKYIKY